MGSKERYFLYCDICNTVYWDNEVRKFKTRKWYTHYKDDFGKKIKGLRYTFPCPKCKHTTSSPVYANRLTISEVTNTRNNRSSLLRIQSVIPVPPSFSDLCKIVYGFYRGDIERGENPPYPLPIDLTLRALTELWGLTLAKFVPGSGPIRDLDSNIVIRVILGKYGPRED